MARIYFDTRPSIMESGIVYGSFDEGYTSLRQAGLELITLPHQVDLRLGQGHMAPVSQQGNWVRERVLYLPDNRVFLTSLPFSNTEARAMMQAHRTGKEYSPSSDELEQIFKNHIELPSKSMLIRFGAFETDPLVRYLCGNVSKAKRYAEFVRETSRGHSTSELPKGIQLNLLRDIKRARCKGPFLRQLWLYGVGADTSSLGADRRLVDGGRLRGYSFPGLE